MAFSVLKNSARAENSRDRDVAPSDAENERDEQSRGRRRRRFIPDIAGLKQAPEADALPSMDVAAGLSRALRVAASEPRRPDDDAVDDRALRDAINAVENAVRIIDKTRDIIDHAYETALSAIDVLEPGGRALIAETYDDMRLAISAVVERAPETAAQLIGKNARQIDVRLTGAAYYSISPIRLDISRKGLTLSPPIEAFETDAEINRILEELGDAVERLDRASEAYCRDCEYLINKLHKLQPI